jgi:hypothetical protein
MREKPKIEKNYTTFVWGFDWDHKKVILNVVKPSN